MRLRLVLSLLAVLGLHNSVVAQSFLKPDITSIDVNVLQKNGADVLQRVSSTQVHDPATDKDKVELKIKVKWPTTGSYPNESCRVKGTDSYTLKVRVYEPGGTTYELQDTHTGYCNPNTTQGASYGTETFVVNIEWDHLSNSDPDGAVVFKAVIDSNAVDSGQPPQWIVIYSDEAESDTFYCCYDWLSPSINVVSYEHDPEGEEEDYDEIDFEIDFTELPSGWTDTPTQIRVYATTYTSYWSQSPSWWKIGSTFFVDPADTTPDGLYGMSCGDQTYGGDDLNHDDSGYYLKLEWDIPGGYSTFTSSAATFVNPH